MISPKGIKRSSSLLFDQDGACNEIINLRFKNNEWQSIQPGTLLGTFSFYTTGDLLFRHNILSDDLLIYWNHSTGLVSTVSITSGNLVSSITTVSGITKIYEFGIILLLISPDDVTYLKYDYDSSSYIQLPPITHGTYTPQESGSTTFFDLIQLDQSPTISASLAALISRRRGFELKGMVHGHVFFRMAFKTYDGNYVMYSPIMYNYIGDYDSSDSYWGAASFLIPAQPSTPSDTISVFWGSWAKPSFYLSFTTEKLATIQAYSMLIDKIVLFMASPNYEWDEGASTTDLISYNPSTGGTQYYLPHTTAPDKYIENNNSFYKIWEQKISELPQSQTIIPDLGDISTLPTNESLPVDNFTHHTYFSDILFEYNSRMHLGAVKTKFGDFQQQLESDAVLTFNSDTFTKIAVVSLGYDVYALIVLKSEQGTRYVLRKQDNLIIYQDTSGDNYIIWNQMIIYPDDTATQLWLLGYDGTNYYRISNAGLSYFNLTSHLFGNYSYNIIGVDSITTNSSFDNATTQMRELSRGALYMPTLTQLQANIQYSMPTIQNYIQETNRLQVSELNNILLFPAANSYRIGNLTNSITGIASQAVDVSSAQFGQYPLYVGSTDGIFTLMQGSGSILYQSIHPVSTHSVNNLLGIEGGIMFITDYGMFLLIGSQPKQINLDVRGTPDTFINSLTSFTNTQTNIPATISTSDFDTFMQTAIFAFDPVNNELYVSGAYTYIFSVVHGVWYKSTASYKTFILRNGKLVGLENTSLYSVSDDDNTKDVNAYMITRPMKFNTFDLKSISRAVLRLIADMSTQAVNPLSFQLYGSLNGFEWKLIQGKDTTDFLHGNGSVGKEMILNFTNTTARYFIILVALKSKVIRLAGIDINAEPKYNNKQR